MLGSATDPLAGFQFEIIGHPPSLLSRLSLAEGDAPEYVPSPPPSPPPKASPKLPGIVSSISRPSLLEQLALDSVISLEGPTSHGREITMPLTGSAELNTSARPAGPNNMRDSGHESSSAIQHSGGSVARPSLITTKALSAPSIPSSSMIPAVNAVPLIPANIAPLNSEDAMGSFREKLQRLKDEKAEFGRREEEARLAMARQQEHASRWHVRAETIVESLEDLYDATHQCVVRAEQRVLQLEGELAQRDDAVLVARAALERLSNENTELKSQMEQERIQSAQRQEADNQRITEALVKLEKVYAEVESHQHEHQVKETLLQKKIEEERTLRKTRECELQNRIDALQAELEESKSEMESQKRRQMEELAQEKLRLAQREEQMRTEWPNQRATRTSEERHAHLDASITVGQQSPTIVNGAGLALITGPPPPAVLQTNRAEPSPALSATTLSSQAAQGDQHLSPPAKRSAGALEDETPPKRRRGKGLHLNSDAAGSYASTPSACSSLPPGSIATMDTETIRASSPAVEPTNGVFESLPAVKMEVDDSGPEPEIATLTSAQSSMPINSSDCPAEPEPRREQSLDYTPGVQAPAGEDARPTTPPLIITAALPTEGVTVRPPSPAVSFGAQSPEPPNHGPSPRLLLPSALDEESFGTLQYPSPSTSPERRPSRDSPAAHTAHVENDVLPRPTAPQALPVAASKTQQNPTQRLGPRTPPRHELPLDSGRRPIAGRGQEYDRPPPARQVDSYLNDEFRRADHYSPPPSPPAVRGGDHWSPAPQASYYREDRFQRDNVRHRKRPREDAPTDTTDIRRPRLAPNQSEPRRDEEPILLQRMRSSNDGAYDDERSRRPPSPHNAPPAFEQARQPHESVTRVNAPQQNRYAPPPQGRARTPPYAPNIFPTPNGYAAPEGTTALNDTEARSFQMAARTARHSGRTDAPHPRKPAPGKKNGAAATGEPPRGPVFLHAPPSPSESSGPEGARKKTLQKRLKKKYAASEAVPQVDEGFFGTQGEERAPRGPRQGPIAVPKNARKGRGGGTVGGPGRSQPVHAMGAKGQQNGSLLSRITKPTLADRLSQANAYPQG